VPILISSVISNLPKVPPHDVADEILVFEFFDERREGVMAHFLGPGLVFALNQEAQFGVVNPEFAGRRIEMDQSHKTGAGGGISFALNFDGEFGHMGHFIFLSTRPLAG
jgi:hypothetical protein